MLKTSTSTDSSTGATHIVVEYDGVDDEGGRSGHFDKKFHPRLQYDSRATHLDAQDELINDSSTSATQIVVKYDEVDGGRSGAVASKA